MRTRYRLYRLCGYGRLHAYWLADRPFWFAVLLIGLSIAPVVILEWAIQLAK